MAFHRFRSYAFGSAAPRAGRGPRSMPYQRQAEVVFAEWREVERARQDVSDGTPEAEALQAEAMRLHDEYERLIDSPSGGRATRAAAIPTVSAS
jgi:hypothetical protein